ncbi:MAG TPA: winged helix-turn-helix domain-containing protein [Pseudohaliea sp.]|nr:winged helix-turn-helix domain-containing protein [Pseudohaliea sp.]
MPSAVPPDLLTYRHFSVDVSRGAVLRDSEVYTLRPQSFRVLHYLLSHPDRLVSKQELFEQIWGDAVVTDDSLAQCLVDIRRALGESGRGAVKTVPRRGYLFQAAEAGAAADAVETDEQRLERRAGARWLAVPVLLLAVLSGWWLLDARRPDQEAAAPAASPAPAPVIAVMPFADFTAGQDMAYLAYGLPEEILNTLTRLQGLRVISRTSSFLPRFSDQKTATEIGEELGATHLLEGSIREHEGMLRITVQLIETGTGHHSWSETIDRGQDDLFRVQSQLAAAVADRFRLSVMRPGEPSVAAGDYTRYLRAIHGLRQGEFSGLGAAALTLEGVLQRNPAFVAAADALAEITLWRVYLGELAAAEGAARVRTLAQDMQAAPSGKARAHGVLAELALRLENDLPGAAAHISRALAIAPNTPRYLRIAGDLAYALHRFPTAVRFYQSVIDLDPLCSACHAAQMQAYLAGGELRLAEQSARRLMALTRGGHFTLALIKTRQGAFDTAQQILDTDIPRKAEPFRRFYKALLCHARGDAACYRARLQAFEAGKGEEEAVRIAQLYAIDGDGDRAFAWLAQARQTDLPLLLAALHDPLFDRLRDDSRWQALVKEVGRSPQQLDRITLDAEALLAGDAT